MQKNKNAAEKNRLKKCKRLQAMHHILKKYDLTTDVVFAALGEFFCIEDVSIWNYLKEDVPANIETMHSDLDKAWCYAFAKKHHREKEKEIKKQEAIQATPKSKPIVKEPAIKNQISIFDELAERQKQVKK
jgi:hypothetical protein